MDEIAPLFLHNLPTHRDDLSYTKQKVSIHYYNEKSILSNAGIERNREDTVGNSGMSGFQPIQEYHKNCACRCRIRIVRGVAHSGMPLIQRRHAHSHVRKRRKERANAPRLHPFFSRRKNGQADNDMVNAPRVDDPCHVLEQCTDGRMTESGKSQWDSRRMLRIGNSRAPRADIKRQDAHGHIERSVTFSARHCGDG